MEDGRSRVVAADFSKTQRTWDWSSADPPGAAILAASTPRPGYLLPLGPHFFIHSTDNVGIGTMTPGYSAKVHVNNGQLAVSENHAAGQTAVFIKGNYNGTGHAVIGSTSENEPRQPLGLVAGDTEMMTLDPQTGKVGIGTTSPAQQLHVVGNILATGSIAPGCSRALKQDIADLEPEAALDAALALKPVTFRYRADAAAEEHVGFIAEDVPDLLATADRKGVDPMDVVAVLTSVVQQQQAQIDALRTELRELESRDR